MNADTVVSGLPHNSAVSHAQTHEQVWVKVNVQVDRGIAKVISALTAIEGLQTLASCEGGSGRPAYVYFNYGSWRDVGDLLFEKLRAALRNRLGDEITVSMEIFNNSEPMGKLTFDKEATDVVASVINDLLHERP